MIGKFLQEENTETEKHFESGNLQTEEKTSADVFALPQTQPEILNDRQSVEEIPVFRESQEIIEPIPLPENQQTYTVAPADVLASSNTEQPAQVQTQTETAGENIRRTGLAWSAVTVLGGSVVFMLILGWFFDLVFGSKPWGTVGGIILGAIIGFIQFFRITSQIFKNDEKNIEHKNSADFYCYGADFFYVSRDFRSKK